MPQASPTENAPDFWRCERCGTPNPRAAYLVLCLGCGRPRRSGRPAERPDEPRPRRISWLALASWAHAAIVLVALALIRGWGDSWWPATALLDSPRFLFLVPSPLLAAWAWRAGRRRLWSLQGATALIVIGPLMGFAIPWASLAPPPEGERLRILTFNAGQGRLDVPALIDLIERERVDLVCLQEREERPDPALAAYFARGWHVDSTRSVASRLPIVAELDPTDDPYPEGEFWPVRVKRLRLRARSGREFLLADAHLPTPIYGFRMLARGEFDRERRYADWRRRQLVRLFEKVGEAGDLPTLIGGDFNMPADSPALSWVKSRFRFGFESAGFGFGYTRPTGLPWVRIDHILASPEWAFTRCRVGPDLGSDHLPLLAEVVLRRE